MASALVEKYIGRRYERWLDYAVYHCGLAGIPDEANDVLNEVLCSLLQRMMLNYSNFFPQRKTAVRNWISLC